jgi:glutamate-1-semialdehyde 2,1-aminomutase
MTSVIGAATARVSLSQAVERYEAMTPRSRAYFGSAVDSLAGGTTRTTVFFDPYPPVVVRGEGYWIEDLDGNRRLDFLNNYTSLILGHADPAVVAAVVEQAHNGTAFAAPTQNELRLAELICSRVRSVERLRFANSGTEATLFAIRLARAFTRRDKILIFEGGYHGTHDYAAANTSAGIPQAVRDTVVSAPFNDLDAVARVVHSTGSDLAAILVEPILGSAGGLPARREFLHGLRELANANGSLLVFDEVISLRVAPGGAQEVYGVRPDLTTLGKIIGGGFPVAAFGGRADVMALLDPRGGSPAIPHGGTFNGNPVGAAAGIATLEALTPAVYARLNALGDRLRSRLTALFERLGLAVQVTGLGSLFNLHFTAEEIVDYRSSRSGANETSRAAMLALMNEGFFLAPRGMGCISTPMGEAQVDALVDAVEKVLLAGG